MSKTNLEPGSEERGRTSKARYYLRNGLAAFGLAAAFGSVSPAPVSGTSSVRQAFANTIRGWTGQIIDDYYHPGKGHAKTYPVSAKEEFIEVKYQAPDEINHRVGQYLLIALVDKGRNGKFEPGSASSVSIHELNDGHNVYYLDAQRTDLAGDWNVSPLQEVPKKGALVTYSYTTGKPNSSLLPLTMQTLPSIANASQTILDDARHLAPIDYPPLPPLLTPIP
jgi:hypothetical protein